MRIPGCIKTDLPLQSRVICLSKCIPCTSYTNILHQTIRRGAERIHRRHKWLVCLTSHITGTIHSRCHTQVYELTCLASYGCLGMLSVKGNGRLLPVQYNTDIHEVELHILSQVSTLYWRIKAVYLVPEVNYPTHHPICLAIKSSRQAHDVGHGSTSTKHVRYWPTALLRRTMSHQNPCIATVWQANLGIASHDVQQE